MPSLSPTMTDGALRKWNVKIGDKIKAGDIIAEIETDKATMELESVDEGIITNILIKEGTESILVNTPIAILNGDINDKVLNSENTNTKKKSQIKPINTNIKNNESIIHHKQNHTKDRIFISPIARKIAKEKNIDIKTIPGSGPNNRIIKKDLKNLENNKSQIDEFTLDYSIHDPSSIRNIIAKKTTQTKSTVPHFYLTIESKVDKLLKLRKQINEDNNSNKISINDFLIKAISIAQYKNPNSNVSWQDGKILKYNTVDISIAVALEEGLITPIIKQANKKGILEIAKETKSLISKAKHGKLSPEEYIGGTITISNLGMYGISEFSAIINPPQSSILAVGSIKNTFRLDENNKIIKENIIKSTLSADHRVLDGAIAAKLLKDYSDLIEEPYNMWLESNDMEII